MNRRSLIALTTLLLTSLALGHPLPKAVVAVPGGAYFTLEPKELEAQLKTKDFPLINVHIPYEGEIAGTDQFIPFDQIASSKLLPKDKKAELVIYCRSGRMSTIAAQTLVRLGYSNVRELRGGFNAWVAAGLKLEQKTRAEKTLR